MNFTRAVDSRHDLVATELEVARAIGALQYAGLELDGTHIVESSSVKPLPIDD
jgi:hypothetical protein